MLNFLYSLTCHRKRCTDDWNRLAFYMATIPSYDVLHTFSSRYLMEDLTDYMKEKGVLGIWFCFILQIWLSKNQTLLHSRKYLDFGRGFYLTSLYEQAVKYAQRFKRREQEAWLNTYEFSWKFWALEHKAIWHIRWRMAQYYF